MATIGRPKKNNPYEKSDDGIAIVRIIIDFLQIFMPITLAKRVVAMILLCAGLPTSHIAELSGLCDRTVRNLLTSMQTDSTESLLSIKRGSGLKRKTSGLEAEIVAEIEKENYHTRQQIADMIEEKFHVHVSVASVGRLLKKKRNQAAKEWVVASKSRHRKTTIIL